MLVLCVTKQTSKRNNHDARHQPFLSSSLNLPTPHELPPTYLLGRARQFDTRRPTAGEWPSTRCQGIGRQHPGGAQHEHDCVSGASALQPDLLAASAVPSFGPRRTLAALASLASISKAVRTAVPCLDDVITCCTRAARAIVPARLQTRVRSSSESKSVLVAQRRTAVLSGA